MSTDYRMVYVTAANGEEARRIGRALVERRLVACANVLGPVESIYVWQGKLEESSEALVLMKTRADRLEAVMSAVRELHSYSCPCIVALPIEAGHAPYLAWIDESLGAP
jgi:periplasmic divalent cation tolerance protein